jgi:hypothetical protein
MPDMLDAKTPDDVEIRAEARKPVLDPTLGIAVTATRTGTPKHRLVTVGDSLTHGFQSGAIFNTSWSYPMMIARELGMEGQFRYPTYDGPGDGLPLNLEHLARQLDQRFGSNLDIWEFVPTLLFLRQFMDVVEDYWERGKGAQAPTGNVINHNLAVSGWDVCNTISRHADICADKIAAGPDQDDFLRQVVSNHSDRSALYVLNTARDAQGNALVPIDAAIALGAEGNQDTGDGDGIETLLILIGANNALGSILTFKVNWSGDGYDDMEVNDQYTVWRPIHFKAELDRLVNRVNQIRARHVIWGTVPHVTIAPFAKGVGAKVSPGSRYYPYYTLPWFDDNSFKPNKHPHITGQEARAIDSAIDQYNDDITEVVRQARQQGRDWYLYDVAGLLDRLASKRYLADPKARPSWWDEVGGAYPLPPELQALDPVPDSRFFIADKTGRKQGGLFSLDGIHPTTIGYGILAQELINVMQLAGVEFHDGQDKVRPNPIQIDFGKLIQQDTLISNPPRCVKSVVDRIAWIDKTFNLFGSILKANY